MYMYRLTESIDSTTIGYHTNYSKSCGLFILNLHLKGLLIVAEEPLPCQNH